MTRRSDRRDFLKHSAAAGIGFWAAGGVTALAQKERAAVERLNIVSVGVGGKGFSDAEQASKVGNLIAVCDIDENHLNNFVNYKTKTGEQPFLGLKDKTYTDYREMLTKLDKEIDAV